MKRIMRFLSLLTITSLLFTQTFFAPIPAKAAAGSLSVLSDTMSRLKKGVNSSHVIKFRTELAINVAADTIVVTFPSDFNLSSSVITDITFTHGASTGAENTETLQASPSATEWGAVFSGTQSRILTLTTPTDGVGSAAVAANDYIIITYASTHVVNATTAGSYLIGLAVTGANTASGNISIVIVEDDQVAVSATVDATLSFSISADSVGFGSFIGTAVRYATADSLGDASQPGADNPVKLEASSNGSRGLSISIQGEGSGAAAGLYNTVASELIPAAPSREAAVAGAKKYGVYGKNASNLVIADGFQHDESKDIAITRVAQTFATYDTVGGGSVDLALLAAVDATTKPGSYADTITLICTGLY